MSKKTIITLWAVAIAVYIANIITICITGTSLFNNILAWSVSIMLAVEVIYLKCSLIDKNKHISEISEVTKKILNELVKDMRGENEDN
jgi:low affinity Fe/Cu permease